MKKNLSLLLFSFVFALSACTGSLVDPSLEQAAQPEDPGLMDEVLPLGLSLVTFRGGEAVRGGRTHKVTWFIRTDPEYTAMDPGFYLSKIEVSKDNGSTWEIPAGGNGIPGVSDAEIAYDWNLPLGAPWEGETFKVRITVQNTKGHVHTIVSGSFTIDNERPTIIGGTLKLNESTDSPYASKSSNLNIAFDAQDALSDVNEVCFKLSSVIQPSEDDPCWKPLSILGLSAGKTVSIRGISQFLGFVGGSFTLYVWVKDKAGNASELISQVGDTTVDSRVINYSPGNTVSFSKFAAANSDAADRLPALSEVQVDGVSASKLILKWAFTVSPGGALATVDPITLEYTNDQGGYVLVNTGPLTNGINGSCTLTDSATGCFEWTVPPELHGQYFRVRLRVKDDANFVYTVASNPVNTGKFRHLAGNTDSGIGGSASQATFNIHGGSLPERTDTGSLAIAEDGRIYIKDHAYGVLLIDPSNGSLRVFLPAGSSIVDGDISTARTTGLLKIALDYQGNLILLEKTRLRKVVKTVVEGVETYSVQTIAGAGATSNRDLSGIAASNFRMSISANQYDIFLTPLPNGDIYFSQSGISTSSGSVDIRVYKADKQKIYPVILSGKGVFGEPYRIISDLNAYSPPGISFNPVTSLVESLHMRWCKSIPGSCTFYASNLNPRTGVSNGTGVHYPNIMNWGNHAYVSSRRGEIYAMGNVSNSGLFKVNAATKQWMRILGNGNIGQCPDGTLATNCSVDITDAFINSDNIVFFLDRNQMRAIGSDGRVATVFGQSKSKGDGGDPLLARFNRIDHISLWGPEDNVMVFDPNESVLREFRPGGVINTIAGNRGRAPEHGWNADRSSQKLATEASLIGLYEGFTTGFTVDRETGEPVIGTRSGSGHSLSRLVRNPSSPMNNKWYKLIHGGAKTLTMHDASSCDGTVNNCSITGLPAVVTGWIPALEIDSVSLPAQALVSSYDRYNSSVRYRCYLKTVQMTDGLVNHIAGNGLDCGGSSSSSTNFPPDGVTMSTSSSMPAIHNEFTRYIYYTPQDSLLMAKHSTRRIVKVPLNRHPTTKAVIGGGSVSTYLETTNNISSFNYLTDLNGEELVVYCGTDGVLRKQMVATGVTTVLPLPSPTMTCEGRSLEVSTDGRKVIFPYKQNGIFAVGEYLVVE